MSSSTAFWMQWLRDCINWRAIKSAVADSGGGIPDKAHPPYKGLLVSLCIRQPPQERQPSLIQIKGTTLKKTSAYKSWFYSRAKAELLEYQNRPRSPSKWHSKGQPSISKALLFLKCTFSAGRRKALIGKVLVYCTDFNQTDYRIGQHWYLFGYN